MGRTRADRNESGFTLIELLIVIVILGVLAGITVFGVAQFRTDSSGAACKADEEIVVSAANAYELQRGSFPGSLEILKNAGYVKDTGVTYTFDDTARTITQGPCPL